jgi:integrase
VNIFALRTIYAQPILSRMGWMQKRGSVWWIGWRHNGKEFRKSTKETVEAEAKKQLEQIEALEVARARGALTSEYFAAVTGRKIEKPAAAPFFRAWLTDGEAFTTKTTSNKYKQVVREFLNHIDADATGILLEDITVDHVSGFFAEKRKTLAPGTVKGYRRILSSIFLLANNQGKIKGNPVALAKGRGKAIEDATTKKRPFTLTELKTLFDAANGFWKYMLTAGFYTGQSMGDLITMRAENVNLSAGMITMNRRKTGKQVIIPISENLRAMLVKLWPKGGKGYFWPDEADRYLKSGSSSFSQEFYDMLASAGLVKKRDEKKKGSGKGRSAKRAPQKIGFHNLRHTFVTHLKIGGAVDSVAKELAGHSSSAVNMVYTHLPAETLSLAIKQLPEVFK